MRIALDVIQEIEDRLGWPQSETIEDSTLTVEQRKLLRLVNRVLSAWTGLDNWPVLRKEGDLVLVAAEESDTSTDGSEQYVTATQNNDVVTVANITFDSTYKGRAFQVSGTDYVYRIVDVPSETTLQLNRAWIDESIDVSDERTFCIGADRYALPTDFDRPSDGFQAFLSPYHVQAVSPQDFVDRRRGQGIRTGEPEVYAIFGRNDGDTTKLLHFDPYPENARLLTYWYQQEHKKIDSDNDKIFIDERYMEAFIEMVLHLAYRDYEDDAKVQVTLADMVRSFNEQRANPDETEAPPVIRPRNRTRSDIRRAAGMSGYRMDYGEHFDNVSNVRLD